VVTIKNAVFWDVGPCRSCVNRCFGGTYRLHIQGRRMRERGTTVSRWLQEEDVYIYLFPVYVYIYTGKRYIYIHLFPVAPILEHRASLNRFVLLSFLILR
jgi:hypothetical protein